MNLKTYLSQQERGSATKLAKQLSISISYLSQITAGTCAVSPGRCIEIEKATSGLVSRKDLRPSDWEQIWPELCEVCHD